VGGKLFIDRTPVFKGEIYGDFRIHERGHDRYWEILKQAGRCHRIPNMTPIRKAAWRTTRKLIVVNGWWGWLLEIRLPGSMPRFPFNRPLASFLFRLRTSIRHLNCMARVRWFVDLFGEIRLSFLSGEEARLVVPDPIRETFSKRPVTTFQEDHRQSLAR